MKGAGVGMSRESSGAEGEGSYSELGVVPSW